MTIGLIRALRILHVTFHRHGPAQRLHILLRFLTAPYLRTIDVIPAGARVLDIGAGHGIYARLIAEDRAGAVIALDPDIRKTINPFRHPRIRFVAGFDGCIRGEFDVVVTYDVLYRLSPAERDLLFARVFDRLRPGGRFVIKEIDPSRRLKWVWNSIQEALAARLFNLTIGKGVYPENREAIAARLARAGFAGFESKAIGFGYPHAHVLYTAKRPSLA